MTLKTLRILTILRILIYELCIMYYELNKSVSSPFFVHCVRILSGQRLHRAAPTYPQHNSTYQPTNLPTYTTPSIYKTKKRPNLSHEMGVFPLSHYFFLLLIHRHNHHSVPSSPYRLQPYAFFPCQPGFRLFAFGMNGNIHISHNNGKHRYHKRFDDDKQYEENG